MSCLKLLIEDTEVIMMPLPAAKAIMIGRDEAINDIVIYDPSVSRAHAKILFEDGHFFLQDLKSSYGTYVNSDRISSRVRLQDTDIILIGTTMMQYVLKEVIANTNVHSPTSKVKKVAMCPNALCGAQVAKEFAYCPHCGTYIGETEDSTDIQL